MNRWTKQTLLAAACASLTVIATFPAASKMAPKLDPEPSRRIHKAVVVLATEKDFPVWTLGCSELASDLWQSLAATPPFVPIEGAEHADVYLRFADGNTVLPDGEYLPPTVVARTYILSDASTGELVTAIIYLNVGSFWFSQSCEPGAPGFGNPRAPRQSLTVTLGHEFGHILGLPDGPGQCANVMEPSVTLDTNFGPRSCLCDLEPGPWDRREILALYGR